ncbi:Ubiquitin carboxyl-terminal hydrolase CYLD [Labeo rohita]|uniref:Ubiquitin carboxyl-terminal hydrolase CYLD n=1 Tax=Labeo rohita TaxID=84645 RepID=A0ABQ8MM17_LABRO|nr:Ubiquitin carboxyl-terminal hydrolase CYLD [Labeo rohita]
MASADNKFYFIITTKHGYISAGEICYIDKQRFFALEKRNDANIVPVVRMGLFSDEHLDKALLQPLSRRSAELLLALESNEKRLSALKDPEVLEEASHLSKDTQVYVEYKEQWLKGVIRYIGSLTSYSSDPITGVYFGVELQGEDKGKGQNDGSYIKTHFKCPKDSGVFAPFTRVRPMYQKPSAPPLHSQSSLSMTSTEPLKPGDRVTFFDDKNTHHGMVMNITDSQEGKMVLISTDKDEDGKQGGEIRLPLDCVIKEELLNKDETEKMDTFPSTEMGGVANSDEITVGSLVQFLGKTLVYGTVRWIGYLPDKLEKIAGLELEDSSAGVTDGTYKGKQYFNCSPHCGVFVKLSSCRPDDRFSGVKKQFNGHSDLDGTFVSVEQENVPPIRTEDVSKRLIGKMKGIQGHCNSCYMDSALFSVFSCSSVLDSLLFKSTEHETIQSILLKNIVNPLRKHGFVSERNVMNLRKQLQKREHCPTYTTDEKDPEEFLSLIMQEILFLDPLLKLCNQSGRMQKEQSCYYYQIFMDYNHHLVLPTVQQLLEHSFYSNSLKLAEVPACLILTMPRSGKSFKMFPKIIPSTELDITGLLVDGPQQCVLCGQLANVECAECFRDTVFSDTGFKYFCEKCSTQVHSHQHRRCHKPNKVLPPQGFFSSQSSGSDRRTPPREKLELFAVLCIETSHYVSFVKYGPKDTDWIFFDKVRACPEVGQYLHMPLAQLANQVPREMEGVAKRLFCDGYMYLYQSKSMSLYR